MNRTLGPHMEGSQVPLASHCEAPNVERGADRDRTGLGMESVSAGGRVAPARAFVSAWSPGFSDASEKAGGQGGTEMGAGALLRDYGLLLGLAWVGG